MHWFLNFYDIFTLYVVFFLFPVNKKGAFPTLNFSDSIPPTHYYSKLKKNMNSRNFTDITWESLAFSRMTDIYLISHETELSNDFFPKTKSITFLIRVKMNEKKPFLIYYFQWWQTKNVGTSYCTWCLSRGT